MRFFVIDFFAHAASNTTTLSVLSLEGVQGASLLFFCCAMWMPYRVEFEAFDDLDKKETVSYHMHVHAKMFLPYLKSD